MDSQLFTLLHGFFSLTPLIALRFPSRLSAVQINKFLLNDLLLNQHFQRFPPSNQYQKRFWKWAITHLETMSRKYNIEEACLIFQKYPCTSVWSRSCFVAWRFRNRFSYLRSLPLAPVTLRTVKTFHACFDNIFFEPCLVETLACSTRILLLWSVERAFHFMNPCQHNHMSLDFGAWMKHFRTCRTT